MRPQALVFEEGDNVNSDEYAAADMHEASLGSLESVTSIRLSTRRI